MNKIGPCVLNHFNFHLSPVSLIIFHLVFLQGRQDVHRGGDHLRGVLAALPRLLHLHLPPQGDRHEALHPARLPRLLLVRHGKLHVQPAHLLLDERKVRIGDFITFTVSMIFDDLIGQTWVQKEMNLEFGEIQNHSCSLPKLGQFSIT